VKACATATGDAGGTRECWNQRLSKGSG